MDSETLYRLNKHADCKFREGFLCNANGRLWLTCAALREIHGACPKKHYE